LAGNSCNPKLEALEILDGSNLLAKPATHLRAGVATRDGMNVVLGQKLVHEVVAAGLVEPCVLLTGVEGKGHVGKDRKGRVFAQEVIAWAMDHLDRAIADRIECLESADDLSSRKGLDLELAVGGIRHVPGEAFTGTIEGVQGFGESR
jgi:hypothetical protein